MPDFQYKARDLDGKSYSGRVEAASEERVADMLRQRSLIPTDITSLAKKKKSLGNITIGGVRLADKLLMIDHLRIMTKAGLPLVRALAILEKQTKSKKLKEILQSIYGDVHKGKDLASGFAKFPKVFSPIFVSLIRIGEESGNLDLTLQQLAQQMEKTMHIRSKIRSALAYPIVVTIALISLIVLVVVYIIPKINEMFVDLKIQLPAATRFLIALSEIINGYPIQIIIGSIVTVIVFLQFRKSNFGKKILHTLLIRLWPFNNIVKKVNLAQFARTLSSLISSGLLITQALKLTADTVKNVLYRDAIKEVAKDIPKGAKMAELLQRNPHLFPSMVVQIIQVGEETGTTANILEKLAEYYEESVDTSLNDLSSIIEPLLMIFIGGGIGLVALAVIAPIYSLVDEI